MMKKTIIVTGAFGLIGSYLLKALTKINYQIYAISQELRQSSQENIKVIQCDLLDFQKTQQIIKSIKADYLIHLAWYVEHEKFWQAKENMTWIAASINILESFASSGKKFIGIGSCAEYGINNPQPDENTPCNPNSFYGFAKNTTRTCLQEYCKLLNLEFAWFRLFHLFAPEESENRFFKKLINSLNNNKIFICNEPKAIRDFLCISDLTEIIAAILEKDTGILNIGSGHPIIMGELATLIAKHLHKEHLLRLSKSTHIPSILIPKLEKFNSFYSYKYQYLLPHNLAQILKLYS